MPTDHRLTRDRHGNIVWPTKPITSFTGRVREATEIVRQRAPKPKFWDVTVACSGHQRTLTIQAKTRRMACIEAISQYRADTKMPASKSILVAECVENTNPKGPDAA